MNKFHAAINSLIRINKDIRKGRADIKEELPIEQWAENFCTVHCNIGRMVGKSEYIKSRAKSGDLVVVYNKDIREFIVSPNGIDCDVVTAAFLDNNKDSYLRAKIYKNIFVDEPELVFSKIKKKKFYKKLASNLNQTFIFLGA